MVGVHQAKTRISVQQALDRLRATVTVAIGIIPKGYDRIGHQLENATSTQVINHKRHISGTLTTRISPIIQVSQHQTEIRKVLCDEEIATWKQQRPDENVQESQPKHLDQRSCKEKGSEQIRRSRRRRHHALGKKKGK